MPLVNPFVKPTDRLKRAINEASRARPDRERAAVDLRSAIDRDIPAVIAAGSTDLAVEAWRTLAGLYAQINQLERAIQVAGEMQEHPFAAPMVPGIVLDLKLADSVTISEQNLLKLAGWVMEGGRLPELIPALRTAREDRFPRSAALATVLGDASLAVGNYHDASVYYHTAIDLAPSSSKLQYLPKLQVLVQVAPGDQLAQCTLGLLNMRQRDFVAATEHLAAADNLGDLETEPLFALADAYLELQRWEEGVAVLERLLQKPEAQVEIARRCEHIQTSAVSGTSVPILRTHQLWGDALRCQTRYEEALDHYRQVLDNLSGDEHGRTFAMGLLERLVPVAQGIAPNGLAECHIELGRAYLLAGQPQPAFESYVLAARTERSTISGAIIGTRRIIAIQPSMLVARLQLADWQIETGEWREALDSLEGIRHDLPQHHATTIDHYELLLARMTAGHSDEQLAGGSLGSILVSVLYALAEELATDAPDEAATCLARILALQDHAQAQNVLHHLSHLQLLKRKSVTARLTEGDAYLALQNYPAALAAYQAVEVNRETVDAVCTRLETLAWVDIRNPTALLVAAHARFDSGDFAAAVAFYRQAFQRAKDQAAPDIVQRFDSLLGDERCPIEAMDLLADALIHQGDAQSLNRALDAIQRMWQAAPDRIVEIVSKSQIVHRQAPAGSKVSARSILLLGEALVVAGRWEEAVVTLAEGVAHPKVDQQHLVELLNNLTQQAPHLPATWLTLGDAYVAQKRSAAPDSLAAYGRALDIDPIQTAQDIIDRLDHQSFGGKNLLGARLLRGEALARTNAHSLALAELTDILAKYRAQAVSGVERVSAWLPDIVSTWLLRAQVEAARPDPVAASVWLNRIIDDGSPSHLPHAEQILRSLCHQFPDDTTCRLAFARWLWRMELTDEAVGVLSDMVTSFPHAREQAMTMLEGMTETAPTASMWLGRARGFIADNNIPAALESLSHAVHDEMAWPVAYEHIRALHADYPERSDVLQALVHVETRSAQPELLVQAVYHARVWLDQAPAQAQQVSESALSILGVLEMLGIERDIVAKDAWVLCTDALLVNRQPAVAAVHLRTILMTWRDESSIVIDRCQQALNASDSVDIRLVLADAYLMRQQYRLVLNVFDGTSYTDSQACQEIVVRCERVITETRHETPRLAAYAARIQAEWLARQVDIHGVSQACRAAATLDPSQTATIVDWMLDHGWDGASQRTLFYEGADILRVAEHPALLSKSIDTYRAILDRDIHNEADHALVALERFPPDYWPAWQLKIEMGQRLGPSHYDQTFNAMHEVLAIFGLRHTREMLAICAQLDANVPGVHLMRADILEAENRLPEAAAALLEMQVSLPDESSRVEVALRALTDRHPTAHYLHVALGDAYRRTDQWDGAMAAYAVAQQADENLVPTLLAKYESALSALPYDVAPRWGLARAYASLEQPFDAARYIDEIIDLDPNHEQAANDFLQALVRRYPNCGHGWYVLGRMAYRSQQSPLAIDYFERAIREQGVLPESSVLLYDMLGRVYHALGEHEAALLNLRHAVALAPDQRPLREAVVSVRLAMLDRAIQIKTTELGIREPEVQTYLQIASLLQHRGHHKEAIGYLQSALQLPEPHEQIYLSLARSFVACQRYDLALASAQAAVRGYPLNTHLDQAELKEALYWLAWSQYHLLEYDEALATLARLCTLDIAYLNVSALIDTIQQEKAAARYAPVPLRYVTSINLIPNGA